MKRTLSIAVIMLCVLAVGVGFAGCKKNKELNDSEKILVGTWESSQVVYTFMADRTYIANSFKSTWKVTTVTGNGGTVIKLWLDGTDYVITFANNNNTFTMGATIYTRK